MSHRDETFRRMLGHEPGETERADMAMLQEAARISDNDPFWGIAAFLYARNPSDMENRERLKVTLASLESFGRMIEGFGRTLEGRSPACRTALQAPTRGRSGARCDPPLSPRSAGPSRTARPGPRSGTGSGTM